MLLDPFFACQELVSTYDHLLVYIYQAIIKWSSLVGSLFHSVIELLSEYMLDLIKVSCMPCPFRLKLSCKNSILSHWWKKNKWKKRWETSKKWNVEWWHARRWVQGDGLWPWALCCVVVTQQNMVTLGDVGPYLVTRILLKPFIYTENKTVTIAQALALCPLSSELW